MPHHTPPRSISDFALLAGNLAFEQAVSSAGQAIRPSARDAVEARRSIDPDDARMRTGPVASAAADPAGGVMLGLFSASTRESLARPGGVHRLVGEGRPLPAAVRAAEEARFGTDFGAVRLHDGPAAHRLARRHLARALTVGPDIVLGESGHVTGSEHDRRLIAHELAHVVQQRSGGGPTGLAHEAAADAAARTVGSVGRTTSAGPPAAMGVQCTPLSPQEIAALTLSELQARIAENEREASNIIISDEYAGELQAESIRLRDRYTALTRGQTSARKPAPALETPLPGPVADDPGSSAAIEPDPRAAQIEAAMAEINAEIADVEATVRLHAWETGPEDLVLTTVRGVSARLQHDVKVVTDFAAATGVSTDGPKARLQGLQKLYAPVLAKAEQWHAANPVGESLGMLNQRTWNWLSDTGSQQFEKGGLHYVSGAAAYAGMVPVAFAEGAETLLGFGFHQTATDVAEAYARGDISWNEVDRILEGATLRALLTAAVTGGAGAATSRLGQGVATAAKLAPRSPGAGALAGGVAGGLTSATAVTTQSLLTGAGEDQFKNVTAQAIWDRGRPQGMDWAIAISAGVLLGAGFGAYAMRQANQELVGTIYETPWGPTRVVAVTPEGMLVLQPVGAAARTPPAPPPGVITMVYDAASGSWVAPTGPGTALATVPPAGPAPAAVPLVPAPAMAPIGPASPALAGVGGSAALPASAVPQLARPQAVTPPARPVAGPVTPPPPPVHAPEPRLAPAEANAAYLELQQAYGLSRAVVGGLRRAGANAGIVRRVFGPALRQGQLPQELLDFAKTASGDAWTVVGRLLDRDVPWQTAVRAVARSVENGYLRYVQTLIGSGRVVRPQVFAEVLARARPHVPNAPESTLLAPRETQLVLSEAARQADAGLLIDFEQGADLLVRESSGRRPIEAFQFKNVSGAGERAFTSNLAAAGQQLAGAQGELPPANARRTVQVRLEGKGNRDLPASRIQELVNSVERSADAPLRDTDRIIVINPAGRITFVKRNAIWVRVEN